MLPEDPVESEIGYSRGRSIRPSQSRSRYSVAYVTPTTTSHRRQHSHFLRFLISSPSHSEPVRWIGYLFVRQILFCLWWFFNAHRFQHYSLIIISRAQCYDLQLSNIYPFPNSLTFIYPDQIHLSWQSTRRVANCRQEDVIQHLPCSGAMADHGPEPL